MMRVLDLVAFLGDSESQVRDMYNAAKIPLRKSGIGRLLEDAQQLHVCATADGRIPGSVENRSKLQSCLLLRSTADALQRCQAAGQDLTHHLNMLRLGDTDLGVPGRDGGRTKFKDFQYEVYLLASLLRRGFDARFTLPSTRAGDITIGDSVLIEAKHPSVPAKLHRYAKAFNQDMSAGPRLRILALGIEDAFGYGRRQRFDTVDAFEQWLEKKSGAVELFWATGFVHTIAACDKILGVLQTVRLAPQIGNEIRLIETGVGHVIARKGAPELALQAVARVMSAAVPDIRIHRHLLAASDTRTAMLPGPGIRMRVPEIEFRPGDRLGVFHAQGDALRGLIYECRTVDTEGAEMEIVREIGPVFEPREVLSLHRQMLSCLGLPIRIVYHPDADRWFCERRAPRPTDLL